MSLWAIVPVKPLRRGKSRLSGVLNEDERALLNYSMLNNTLKTLAAVDDIDEILVVSRDPSALILAREIGGRTVQEVGSPELNSALKRATSFAQLYSASSVLILPADLPLISSSDIQDFISHSGKPPEIVISPDRREEGTNALLVSPPGIIDYQFGPGSFQKHIQQAQRSSLRVDVCKIMSIGLDLDLPEDLELLKQMEAPQIDQ